MDTKRLRYFCAIYEQGQISRAAKMLNISQPPLSQRLKELEEELGTVLIIRDHGRWEITAAGELLYVHAKKIIDDLDGVREQVQDALYGFSGQISIGVSTACLTFVAEVLPGLHQKYPKIRFRVNVTDSNYLEKSVLEKSLDLAVLLLPLEENGLEVTLLPEDRFAVVFRSGTGLPQHTKNLSLLDLADVPLILSRRWNGWGGYATLMAHWQKQGKQPQVILDSQNIQAIIRFLECGLPAAAIIPACAVTDAMKERLVVRPLQSDFMVVQPAIIHHKDKFLSRAATILRDAIIEYAWQGAKEKA